MRTSLLWDSLLYSTLNSILFRNALLCFIKWLLSTQRNYPHMMWIMRLFLSSESVGWNESEYPLTLLLCLTPSWHEEVDRGRTAGPKTRAGGGFMCRARDTTQCLSYRHSSSRALWNHKMAEPNINLSLCPHFPPHTRYSSLCSLVN